MIVVVHGQRGMLADSKLSSVTNSPSGTATWQCGSTPPGSTSSPVASAPRLREVARLGRRSRTR